MSSTHAAHHDDHHHMSFWQKYVFSVDHKVIGMQYLLTGIFMGVIGAYMSYVFRMQLAFHGAESPSSAS